MTVAGLDWAPYTSTLTGTVVLFVLSFDLFRSLQGIKNKPIRRRIQVICAMILLLQLSRCFVFAYGRFFCDYWINVAACLTYINKVLVAYLYYARIDIAIKTNNMKTNSNGNKLLVVFQLFVAAAFLFNVLKGIFVYKGFSTPVGCGADTGGIFWASMDEFLFGFLDLFTLIVLSFFYYKNTYGNSNSFVDEHVRAILQRIIFFASITLVMTVITIVVFNTGDQNTRSFIVTIDVLVDNITLFLTYNPPARKEITRQETFSHKDIDRMESANASAMAGTSGTKDETAPRKPSY